MRRCLELMILVGTAGILVATSQARSPCATEITKLRAETTCGPAANVVVTSDVTTTATATATFTRTATATNTLVPTSTAMATSVVLPV